MTYYTPFGGQSRPAMAGKRKDVIMMAVPPALLVRKSAAAADPQLQPGARGARKHLVTVFFEAKEQVADQVIWAPPAEGEKCAVVVTANLEVSSFTEVTVQDRHHHLVGTETYLVLGGTMHMEVDGEVYTLFEGDQITVNPGAAHEVIREGNFLCRVITANCGGSADKFPD